MLFTWVFKNGVCRCVRPINVHLRHSRFLLSSHAGRKKYPEEGAKNVLKTAEKYDCSQFLQGGHNKKGGSSTNKSQIDIFPVLYSHFKYFNQTIFTMLLILSVYIMAAYFQLFQLSFWGFGHDFGGWIRILQYPWSLAVVATCWNKL